MYVGRQTKYITKIFRRTNLKVAYKTRNAIEHETGDSRQVFKYINFIAWIVTKNTWDGQAECFIRCIMNIIKILKQETVGQTSLDF